MSEAQSKPPRFVKGPAIGVVDKLNQLSDWAWRNRTIFSERFTTTQTAAGKVVDLANTADAVATGIATTTITAASSKSTFPVTYGTGSVKLDLPGATTCTQSATAVTVRNRAPVSFASGDLLYLALIGGKWTVINRYCP